MTTASMTAPPAPSVPSVASTPSAPLPIRSRTVSHLTRLDYVDPVRIAGCFAVVFIHAVYFLGVVPATTLMDLHQALCMWAVPCFLMMSGAILLARGRDQSPGRF